MVLTASYCKQPLVYSWMLKPVHEARFALCDMTISCADAKADLAAFSNGSGEATVSNNGSELSVKDRETARRNFKRVSSMQREQLGLAGQPLPDAPLPDGITPEQLFPGTCSIP